ncbi:MAG: TetR/AcrR family transcriptional regulator [Candidatus Marinimicrobia bacterium]|nr:TetR/AcrR family transcriptional regulator [Candidatus Neomarinimicrobiota bacterium]
MPKIFSDNDRKLIKDKLIEAGSHKFQRFGLRKTSVAELAQAAGIAKGTFYHFFQSKEDLCMEIFDREQSQISQDIDRILEEQDQAETAFKAVLDYSLTFIINNSLIQRLRALNEMPLLARGIDKARLEEYLSHDIGLSKTIIQSLKKKGAEIDISPPILAGIMRAMVMTAVHEEEIGGEVYTAVMDQLFQWIATGLTEKGSPNES